MIATTFAPYTPLVVTGLATQHGVAGNWLWWNMVMSGTLAVFLYARLWRRAGVMTDVEFVEIRYSGWRATFPRAFRALYLALPINLIIMGWVTLAMVKILGIALGLSPVWAVGVCFAITVASSTALGHGREQIPGGALALVDWGLAIDTLHPSLCLAAPIRSMPD